LGQEGDYLLRAVQLSKKYRSGESELVVFEKLELTVAPGERVAVVGSSGAGKSTLLHLLGGLDRPTDGTIYYRQKAISALSDAELADYRNREVGFVWQTHYLLPEFTAEENVMMPLLIRGRSHTEAGPLARTALEEVGLGSRVTHRSGELSGGEQQRVVLARALVAGPALLLADEPTGNLDMKTGEKIVGLLAELHKAHGLTSIFVTHNLSFAERCDRILKLEGGVLVPLEGIQHGRAYV
jgi:lipoprotein-releasing system ATP-binding protein